MAAAQARRGPRELAREYPAPDEDRYTAALIDLLRSQMAEDYPPGRTRRDAHPKMHGCVRAELVIDAGLDSSLRAGIFSEPRSYPAWLRFSNAFPRVRSDRRRDIRGLAIKLFDVAGEKLLDDERDAPTHDLLLISSPTFLTRDVREFFELTRAFGHPLRVLGFFFAPPRPHVLRQLLLDPRRCDDLLATTYWSATPYLLGSHAVKFSVAPLAATDAAPPARVAMPENGLRERLCQRLAAGPVELELRVQLQRHSERMPIEDACVRWPESESPFVRVGTLRLPVQDCDTEERRHWGEELSYTPWHALPEHRPLGGINRARKEIYRALSQFRHQRDGRVRREPRTPDLAAELRR